MTYYLVDYENTSIKGVAGIERLVSEDKLIIFYGPKTGSVPFEDLVKITATSAALEFHRTTKTAKNYLDFQLTSYIGYLIAAAKEEEYVIISGDSGFDAVVDFWSEHGIRISRFKNLNRELPEVKEPAKKSAGKTAAKSTAKKTTGTTSGRTKKSSSVAKKDPAENENSGQSAVKQKGGRTSKAANGQKSKGNNNGGNNGSSNGSSNGSNANTANVANVANGATTPAIPEAVKKKIRAAFKEEGLRPGAYRKLYACMLESADKAAFNTALVHAFTQEIGNKYYKLALPAFSGWTK